MLKMLWISLNPLLPCLTAVQKLCESYTCLFKRLQKFLHSLGGFRKALCSSDEALEQLFAAPWGFSKIQNIPCN